MRLPAVGLAVAAVGLQVLRNERLDIARSLRVAQTVETDIFVAVAVMDREYFVATLARTVTETGVALRTGPLKSRIDTGSGTGDRIDFAARSSAVSKSTVTHRGVPISSSRR